MWLLIPIASGRESRFSRRILICSPGLILLRRALGPGSIAENRPAPSAGAEERRARGGPPRGKSSESEAPGRTAIVSGIPRPKSRSAAERCPPRSSITSATRPIVCPEPRPAGADRDRSSSPAGEAAPEEAAPQGGGADGIDDSRTCVPRTNAPRSAPPIHAPSGRPPPDDFLAWSRCFGGMRRFGRRGSLGA